MDIKRERQDGLLEVHALAVERGVGAPAGQIAGHDEEGVVPQASGLEGPDEVAEGAVLAGEGDGEEVADPVAILGAEHIAAPAPQPGQHLGGAARLDGAGVIGGLEGVQLLRADLPGRMAAARVDEREEAVGSILTDGLADPGGGGVDRGGGWLAARRGCSRTCDQPGPKPNARKVVGTPVKNPVRMLLSLAMAPMVVTWAGRRAPVSATVWAGGGRPVSSDAATADTTVLGPRW